MEITKTEQIKKVQIEGSDDYEDKVVAIIIGHPDHKGKVRYHTEDELREMKTNLEEVIAEVDKK